MNNERGFTLIEALVATLVLTIGLVATAQLLAVSLRMHQIGRNSTAATRLAQDKFEELMKLQFSNPAIQINATDTLASNVPNYNDTPANSGTRGGGAWKPVPAPTPASGSSRSALCPVIRTSARAAISR